MRGYDRRCLRNWVRHRGGRYAYALADRAGWAAGQSFRSDRVRRGALARDISASLWINDPDQRPAVVDSVRLDSAGRGEAPQFDIAVDGTWATDVRKTDFNQCFPGYGFSFSRKPGCVAASHSALGEHEAGRVRRIPAAWKPSGLARETRAVTNRMGRHSHRV